MSLSFEEFRERLSTPGGAASLGLTLTDAEGVQVHADESASRSWYDYWVALVVPAAPGAATQGATTPAVSEALPAGAGGHDLTALRAAPGAHSVGSPAAALVTDASARTSRTGLWVLLSVLGALVLIAVIVLVVALTTARHWTKVDVPEQPETFHSEEYETGRFDVAMDDVNPCFVDQAWSDCINAMAAEYGRGVRRCRADGVGDGHLRRVHQRHRGHAISGHRRRGRESGQLREPGTHPRDRHQGGLERGLPTRRDA